MKGRRRLLANAVAVGALLMAWAAPAGASAVPTVGTGSTAGPATLWPLGDSITYGLSGGASAGGIGEETVTPGGYRGMLYTGLQQDGISYQFVGTSTANPNPVLTSQGQAHHDGHPGYRIDQDAADLDGVAGANSDDGGDWMTRSTNPIQPDVAIVLLGGNDILQRYDPTTSYATANGEADYTDSSQVSTFVSDMTARLQSLLTKLETLRPGLGIVLCDTTPIGTTAPDPVTGVYAQAVANLATQESSSGMNVSFVDIWSLFVQQTPKGPKIIQGTLGPDGVHPSSAGYQLIANALRTPVEQQLTTAS